MEMWPSLVHGFSVALQPMNLIYALAGCILGTVTGILPGIGPLGAMAILLSFTLYIDATGAMILFAGIYYGAMYGGSTTSILLNIPGENSSVITCIDGYQMTLRGRGGAALTVAAVGSFVAGTISIIGLMVAASLLGRAALQFGPPEFVAIAVCGFVLLMKLGEESLLKSAIMIFAGLALCTVGTDYLTGTLRFTLGVEGLIQGIEFLPVAIGLFGISEVLETASASLDAGRAKKMKFRELLPNREEWRRSTAPMLRGSVIGFLIGLIPGPAPMISTFVSYITEKKISKRPKEFGRGAIEGVAGPESANNAAVGGAYVPLLALGIPFTPAMAMVLGALLLHNITPGPNLIQEKPNLFWGVIASMYVANFMLLFLNLPMVNVFVNVLRTPRQILLPIIVMLSLVGVYSTSASALDLFILGICGILGFAIRRVGFKPAPLIIAMVIGPMLENSLRQSLLITGGDFAKVIFRPISLTLYAVAVGVIVLPWLWGRRSKPPVPKG
ncbi:MAG: tripartite tricarboxylate transporter permease [Syntrophaceae bacterium]|nr:tripartite tricarboxylate transporter permease [Syntrophaceae bacterium]